MGATQTEPHRGASPSVVKVLHGAQQDEQPLFHAASWDSALISDARAGLDPKGLILQDTGKLLVKTVKVTEKVQKRHPGHGNHPETICKASPSSHQCSVGKEVYWSCSWTMSVAVGCFSIYLPFRLERNPATWHFSV
ncbi:uncharacterized protein M6G45_008643 [Spheniscus humboldti]